MTYSAHHARTRASSDTGNAACVRGTIARASCAAASGIGVTSRDHRVDLARWTRWTITVVCAANCAALVVSWVYHRALLRDPQEKHPHDLTSH